MAQLYVPSPLDGTESADEEIKKMVTSFRVNELQSLLSFGNKSKLGKKNELLQRALELVRSNRSLPLQQKVRELYKRRFREMRGYDLDDALAYGSDPPPPLYPSAMSVSGNSGQATYNQAAAFQTITLSASMSHQATADQQRQKDCARLLAAQANAPHMSCQNVRFTNLPFYDVTETLLKPMQLRVTCPDSTYQDNYLPFSLNPQKAAEINYPETAPLPRTEVQLRFCLLDSSCEQKDDFPSGCEVRINEKPVILPNLIPTNKPGTEPKRPSRPVNVTSYCNLTQPQRMHIYWSSKKTLADKHYVVGLFLVQRLTASILLKRLTDRPLLSADVSRKMIQFYWSSDNEIATESLRASLLCPVGKMRMKYPCRLAHCQHLQCFDADVFLRMNEKRPTWMCPVCDRPTPFQDLIIDGYFTKVLEDAPKDINEVELLESGGWEPVKEEDDPGSDDDDDDWPVAMAPQSTAPKETLNKKEPAASTTDPSGRANNNASVESSSGRQSSSSNNRNSSSQANQSGRIVTAIIKTKSLNSHRSTRSASSASNKNAQQTDSNAKKSQSLTASANAASEILIDLTCDSDDDDSDKSSRSSSSSTMPQLIVASSSLSTTGPPPLSSNLTGAVGSTSGSRRGMATPKAQAKDSNAATLIVLDSPPSGESATPDDPVDPHSRSNNGPPTLAPSSDINAKPVAVLNNAEKQQLVSSASSSIEDLLAAAFRSAEAVASFAAVASMNVNNAPAYPYGSLTIAPPNSGSRTEGQHGSSSMDVDASSNVELPRSGRASSLLPSPHGMATRKRGRQHLLNEVTATKNRVQNFIQGGGRASDDGGAATAMPTLAQHHHGYYDNSYGTTGSGYTSRPNPAYAMLPTTGARTMSGSSSAYPNNSGAVSSTTGANNYFPSGSGGANVAASYYSNARTTWNANAYNSSNNRRDYDAVPTGAASRHQSSTYGYDDALDLSANRCFGSMYPGMLAASYSQQQQQTGGLSPPSFDHYGVDAYGSATNSGTASAASNATNYWDAASRMQYDYGKMLDTMRQAGIPPQQRPSTSRGGGN